MICFLSDGALCSISRKLKLNITDYDKYESFYLDDRTNELIYFLIVIYDFLLNHENIKSYEEYILYDLKNYILSLIDKLRLYTGKEEDNFENILEKVIISYNKYINDKVKNKFYLCDIEDY